MDVAELERQTLAADEAVREARARFVSAVRKAHAEGMSQRKIAAHSGRSQAEISRLLRFHGVGERARRLRAARGELLRILGEGGLENVRVFGSLTEGRDNEDSDVDILVTSTKPLGLMEFSRIEIAASEAVGLPIDLVPDDSIRPDLRDRILAQAVPL